MNNNDSFIENKYMKQAISLAQKGTGFTSPNPLVGAVIVKDGEVIGEGFHEHYGELHAERNAINSCTKDPSGATIYVTLEPCCHHGKQPPCTEAIIKVGIKHVIIGSKDPNPVVAGKGIEILKNAGIQVTTGILEDECDQINHIFFHYIKTNRPYVVMKYAMTMDGKIATHTGDSKWVTGEIARRNVHMDRHKYSAIMVGVNTVISDDPMLNCRIENMKTKNPIRIICDSNLRTPLDSKIVKTARDIPTIIVTCLKDKESSQQKNHLEKKLIENNCKILSVPSKDGHINLNILMDKLGSMGIDSVFLEGGGTLNEAALRSNIVQKVQAYIAPKLTGGINALGPIGGTGISLMNDSVKLKNSKIIKLGEDFLIESEVDECSQE